MKNVLVAFACTLGFAAAACGESRPAEDPSTHTTAITTEVTSTSAAPKTNTTNGSADTAKQPTRATATTGVLAPQADSTSQGGVQTYGTPDGKAGTDTSATGTGTGKANPPTTNNPGVANGTKDADNTKINDRDRHGALTPMDQGGGKDRDITAAIRRLVVGDGSLSFTAKNVKIITVGGKVTLRGPVKSDAEKTAIESKAKATAGVAEVDNQLEVKK